MEPQFEEFDTSLEPLMLVREEAEEEAVVKPSCRVRGQIGFEVLRFRTRVALPTLVLLASCVPPLCVCVCE